MNRFISSRFHIQTPKHDGSVHHPVLVPLALGRCRTGHDHALQPLVNSVRQINPVVHLGKNRPGNAFPADKKIPGEAEYKHLEVERQAEPREQDATNVQYALLNINHVACI